MTICRFLEAQGLRCWIAPRDVLPGAEWDEAILTAIEASQIFLLLLSSAANLSPFVKNEVNRAFANRKTILTYRTEDVLPSRSLEFYLARHHWTDGFPPPVESATTRLASAILALLGRAPAAVTAQPDRSASIRETAARRVAPVTGTVGGTPAVAQRHDDGALAVQTVAPQERYDQLLWSGPRLPADGIVSFCVRAGRAKRQPLEVYRGGRYVLQGITFYLKKPIPSFSAYVTFDGHVIRSIADPEFSTIDVDVQRELTVDHVHKYCLHIEDGTPAFERVEVYSNTNVIEIVLPCSR
jgi:hypothetical protein